MFGKIKKNSIVWVNRSCVRRLMENMKLGKAVKALGEDGWPGYYEDNNIMVRLSNTPPPVPVSTFSLGEIVVSKEYLVGYWQGGVG